MGVGAEASSSGLSDGMLPCTVFTIITLILSWLVGFGLGFYRLGSLPAAEWSPRQ